MSKLQMSMLSKRIKNNFLILGFTGPLASGCTSAANFLNDYRGDKWSEYYPDNIQKDIEKEYLNLSSASADNRSKPESIKDIRIKLRYLLKSREIFKVLSSHELPIFYYISMSNMLLKYSIEHILFNKADNDPKYNSIVELIRGYGFDATKIKSVLIKLSEKRYREIDSEECRYYDDYLLKIDNLMRDLKNTTNKEVIGDLFQDMGDNIRKSGTPFQSNNPIDRKCLLLISEQANSLIKYYRNRRDDEKKVRRHFLIESFRNPYEVEYFRYRYYEFYLLSIYADEVLREDREGYSKKRNDRDVGKGNKLEDVYKQNVSRCVYMSDISINNNDKKREFHRKILDRLALILSPGCIGPTRDEMFMNQAYSLSLRSGCISRQVGAVIVNKYGYIIGAGWNDPGEGQIGCGYRHVLDIINLSNKEIVTNPKSKAKFRSRLQKLIPSNISFCFKDEMSQFIIDEKVREGLVKHKEQIREMNLSSEQFDIIRIIQEWFLEDVKVKRLDYCRALHAEENALMQSAKIGGLGVSGGTIYTTSFPCELCAKKIYQSGIEKVIYVEPYPDSISEEVIFKDGFRDIKLIQFEGVKSHSYFRLYKPPIDKKEYQELQNM